MASVNYTLRIDEADKQQAEQVFKALGMTFATGINIYLKAVGQRQRIPFDLSLGKHAAAEPAALRFEREKSFNALNGILAGHEIDLDKEREERISAK
jgi:addiction module RelB/DinJ family antitoxin